MFRSSKWDASHGQTTCTATKCRLRARMPSDMGREEGSDVRGWQIDRHTECRDNAPGFFTYIILSRSASWWTRLKVTWGLHRGNQLLETTHRGTLARVPINFAFLTAPRYFVVLSRYHCTGGTTCDSSRLQFNRVYCRFYVCFHFHFINCTPPP